MMRSRCKPPLLLSILGIYGVVGYIGGMPIHEMGIRMALGAQPAGFCGWVAGQGLELGLPSIGAGARGALWARRAGLMAAFC